jgi:peptidyl-prolyl cis-trans isomerase B (cyclophilin B)
VTREQERARARRRYERQQAAAAARHAERERNKRVVVVVALVLVVVAGFVGLANVLGKNDSTGKAAGATASSTASSTASVSVAGCAPPPTGIGTSAQLKLPDKKAVEGKTYSAVITTNCGDITVELDGTEAPQAVASFKSLAANQYWLNSACHRLTTQGIFVLQCGDPTGTGSGTPGYGFGVENAPANGKYPAGTLAMARTNDPKKGNGGQFFIVYKDSTLPTDTGGYTIFGKVTGGMDIVKKIAEAGVQGGATDGAPAAPISILRVAVTEKKA